MLRSFSYEKISFEYQLVEENRKTIAATVTPAQTITIKSPIHPDEKKLDHFLKKRCVWIVKQRRYFAQFSAQETKKDYLSGESLQYLGRRYKLLVHVTTGIEKVVLQKGSLNVFVKLPSHTEKLINRWLAEKRIRVFNDILKASCELFQNQAIPALKINKLRKRWGSYLSNNTIILNPQLIQATKKQIQYVIFHELCHINHKKHDKAFYSLLSKNMPDWKKVKTELELSLMS